MIAIAGNTLWGWFMIAILGVLCLTALVICGGFLYQLIGAKRDKRLYSVAGRWIDIGRGCQLYLVEKGRGGPTVLFEAGIAATNLNWLQVQEAVSQFTHTASYDRGGLGWSSPSQTARTPSNIVAELHDMLQAAGIGPPYVLVGHSFGGLVMRRYALRYPEEVAGVVLVDPMRCEEWPPIDAVKQATLDRGVRMSRYAVPIARFGLARLAVTSLLCRSGSLSTMLAGAAGDGGKHVLGRIKEEVGKMPTAVWPAVAAHWSHPAFYEGMSKHVAAVPETVCEMQDADPILHIPVVLLTPGKSIALSEYALSRIGDNVQQIIAEDSAHWIHLDEPDLVIGLIRDMVMTSIEQPVSGARSSVHWAKR